MTASDIALITFVVGFWVFMIAIVFHIFKNNQ